MTNIQHSRSSSISFRGITPNVPYVCPAIEPVLPSKLHVAAIGDHVLVQANYPKGRGPCAAPITFEAKVPFSVGGGESGSLDLSAATVSVLRHEINELVNEEFDTPTKLSIHMAHGLVVGLGEHAGVAPSRDDPAPHVLSIAPDKIVDSFNALADRAFARGVNGLRLSRDLDFPKPSAEVAVQISTRAMALA